MIYTVISAYSFSEHCNGDSLCFLTPLRGGDGSKKGSTRKDARVFSSVHQQKYKYKYQSASMRLRIKFSRR